MRAMIFDGTPDEIADLLQRIPQLNLTATSPVRNASISSVDSPFALWSLQKVTELHKHIRGDQKKIVEFLMSRGGKATRKDLQDHLGFPRGPKLAGVLANITRNAQRITKYKDAKFVEKFEEEKNGKLIRGYYIPQALFDLLQRIDGREEAVQRYPRTVVRYPRKERL
jgi:hypothetical protein